MSFGRYSLRMIDLMNISTIPDGGKLCEEALRVRSLKKEAKFFGFNDLVVSVILPWRKEVKNRVLKAFRDWENETCRKYNVSAKQRLLHYVEIEHDGGVLVDGEKVMGEEEEHYQRYKNLPLPCLELRFTTVLQNNNECEVILTTVGIPSICGILQLLAPLTDSFQIFHELMEDYGIKVTEVAEVGEK